MTIKHQESDSKGSFRVEAEAQTLAEMTYSKAGKQLIIIDHTDVAESQKGKGLGQQLVMAAVAHARQQGIKILPLCPFASSVFKKTPDIADVLN